MAYSVSNVAHYDFKADDKLFLDMNVWLLVYGVRRPFDSRVSVYSAALDRILRAGSRIHIDILIVPEFINAYTRQNANLGGIKKFKNFRNSPAFRSIAQDTAQRIKEVLSHCSCMESGFETLDTDALIDKYTHGGTDFNDLVIEELCKNRDLKLITDDGDFKNREISVLTANKRLLD